MTQLLDRSLRARTISALNREWPVQRGVDVDQETAREAVWRLLGSNPNGKLDRAALDASLTNLIAGGLLTWRWHEAKAEKVYTRPEADIEPPAVPAVPPQQMWHPADGGDPVPYADVLAAQKAATSEPTTTVLDAATAPPWATYSTALDGTTEIRIDLRAIPHTTAVLAITLAGSAGTDKKGKRRWLA